MIKNILKNNLRDFVKSPIFIYFLLALLIRFLFVFSEYPFVFHPDEPTVVNSTINLRFDLNPKHFDWPTFYYYFNFPFFFTFEKLYFLVGDLGLITQGPIPEIYYYLLSRFLTIFFGSGTVITVYFILKNLNVRQESALIGAAIMALLPFHVSRSAQALTDAPMVFFASLSLLFLTKILTSFNQRFFLYSCFFAGLSVSTKYNGYMIFLTIALFIIFIKGLNLKDIKLYFLSGFYSFLGFFIGTPYFIFDYDTFFSYEFGKGALWQFENVGKVSLVEQFHQFFNNLFLQNYSVTGYIPLICSILFILFFWFKREFLYKDNFSKFLTILTIQFVFIFWSVSGIEKQQAHYLFLIYLFLPIFTVLWVEKYFKLKFAYEFIFIGYVALTSYSLITRISDSAVMTFYKRLEVVGDRNNLLVSYNKKDIEKILEKFDIPNVRFNPKSQSFSSKVTHVVSTTDVCYKKNKCGFVLIDKIDSISNSEVVYVFKRK
jgi:hypothetical protein